MRGLAKRMETVVFTFPPRLRRTILDDSSGQALMEKEPRPDPLALESTRTLLSQVRAGNGRAAQVLYERHIARLERWAKERLPASARGAVRETLLSTLRGKTVLDSGESGDFQASLREGLLARLRAGRQPPSADETAERVADAELSPVEEALGRRALERYERAMGELSAGDREAIVARIEMGLSYEQIALELGKEGPEAARQDVSRAIARLAQTMRSRSDAEP